MLYYELKSGHVIVACLLLAACLWSLLPIQDAWNKALWWRWTSRLNASFRRMLWVIPLGVLQGVLGMATLSVEPGSVPTADAASLLIGFLLLGLLWLVGMAAVKYGALVMRQQHSLRIKKIQRLFQVWIFLLVAVFIAMLAVMVNFR